MFDAGAVDLGVWQDAGALDGASADSGDTDIGLWDMSTSDLGETGSDAGDPDGSAPDLSVDLGGSDAGGADQGAPDLQGLDGSMLDTGLGDGGPNGDAGADGGPGADAGAPDMGPAIPDQDNDGISDADEGDGLIDTDNDGIPDTMDADSDNDGIPDADEAGDVDPATPPLDSDNDGTPDFRDLDSDNDNILDVDEGLLDPDGDGLPNFLDTDSDNDLILDIDEGTADPDNDALPNYLDVDSDNDNILDRFEGVLDPDGDTLPNYLDADSDGDGILDIDEAGDANLASPAIDSDFDGTPNYLDLDSDNDNILDAEETAQDPDGDGLGNYIDIDSDNDGLLDVLESGDALLQTPAFNSDNDALPDYLDDDSDNDTILDTTEGTLDPDGDLLPNYIDPDSDGDSWTDAVEAGDALLNTFPFDTDQDGSPDYLDLDSDADALADSVEPGCPAGPERLLPDSDNDGFLDSAELVVGSDPCNNASVITDFHFVLPPLGPGANAPLTFANTDLDRVDVAINIDTTGSMLGEINNLQTTLSTNIIPGVGSVIPDAAFSVSAFGDYPVLPFGNIPANDLPFVLATRVTTDAAVAQAAVNALALGAGDDLPESGLESLYQVATGAGTAWTGGSVPAFNPAQNSIPQVADGALGGVGFRNNALPVVVHITDALSHTQAEYLEWDPQITAAATPDVFNALGGLGARVVTIASNNIPRPLDPALFAEICDQTRDEFFGSIEPPVGTDVDSFLVNGAPLDVLVIESFAERRGSTLDTMITVRNANDVEIGSNNDEPGGTNDSLLQVALTGPGPYTIDVFSAFDNNGTGTTNRGFYFLAATLNGQAIMPSPTACRPDDGNTTATATPLVLKPQAALPASIAQCAAACQSELDVVFDPLTTPYAIAEATGASVPTCAWDTFGTRPAGCGAGQCCTGTGGAGEPPNALGECPLSFTINENGQGLGATLVSGIEALVRSGLFEITTVVRADPAELAASGVDTSCFIQSIIPISGTSPNACVQPPVPADLFPPAGQLDSFTGVAPGSQLQFDVQALNQAGAGVPCAAQTPDTRVFQAWIDVVADNVTVVDTRNVVIIVPGSGPVSQ